MNNLYVSAFFVLLITFSPVKSQTNCQIFITPQDLTVAEGDRVMIDCNHTCSSVGDNSGTFWLVNNTLVNTDNPNFNINTSTSDGVTTLTISFLASLQQNGVSVVCRFNPGDNSSYNSSLTLTVTAVNTDQNGPTSMSPTTKPSGGTKGMSASILTTFFEVYLILLLLVVI